MTPPPRVRRDCHCPKARHQHGTKSAYQQCKCRCYPCTNAYLAAYRAWTRGITEPRHPSSIPVTGTRRRIEALHANGWSDAELAKRLGTTLQHVHKLRCLLQRVQPPTAEAVARLYDELWDKPAQGAHVVKVRRIAARKGYAPPLAWDDDEIDDPDAKPHMPRDTGWVHKPCGTRAAYRRHLRRGEKPCSACVRAESERPRNDGKKAAA